MTSMRKEEPVAQHSNASKMLDDAADRQIASWWADAAVQFVQRGNVQAAGLAANNAYHFTRVVVKGREEYPLQEFGREVA